MWKQFAGIALLTVLLAAVGWFWLSGGRGATGFGPEWDCPPMPKAQVCVKRVKPAE